ncbi:MAG: YbaN family protein [Caldimonas sp.]|uniref:YbaN family protein n=1 Tax=Caldimonas sp. TaxID=2838790 RepID=UPI003919524E
MIRHTRLLLWRALAGVSLLLGLVGVVLPVLPTVPFLLLAAWAGGRGWPSLEARLLAHPRHGPVIRQWREHGAVPRRAKWLATAMMLGSATVLWWSPVAPWIRGAVYLVLLGVALWLWRRPEA